METLSALLALCARNSTVPGEFPAQRPVTRGFDVFFDLRLNKLIHLQDGNINEMQFGFVPGRVTTETTFIVCQLQAKYIAAKKLLYFAFVDLEKAFNLVPKRSYGGS